MGFIIDLRKYHLDNLINDLVDASKIKRRWWGRASDNYWNFLSATSSKIDIDLNAHIVADYFVYVFDRLGYKEVLNKYSSEISTNRGGFVLLLVPADYEFLLTIISKETFTSDFENFTKELNGQFYQYDAFMLNETIKEFKSVLEQMTWDFGLIINIA